MVNDEGNEVVLTSDEKKYLLSILKEVFASPREEIYEVNTHLIAVRINIHNTQYFRLELGNSTIRLEMSSSGLPRQVQSTSPFLMSTEETG